jgi:FAD binding domain/Berberine and berberine like
VFVGAFARAVKRLWVGQAGEHMKNREVLTASGRTLPEKAVLSLERCLRGQLIHPSDTEYEAKRRVWVRAIDRRPLLIARCASAEDVVAAIKFAREHELPTAVRSGGHSSFGTCDRGLVIDLSLMKRIEIDLKNRLVRAESGLTSGELDAATFPHGVVAPVGECPTTGIGGVTLGGGIGYLLGCHGLTCDNLVRAELIDARGERHIASPQDDSDLFWALRGGGGNFGVVTSLTYTLHPIAQVLAGYLAYPVSQAAKVLRFLGEVAKETPDELALIATDNRSLTSEHALSLLVCWSGEPQRGEEVLAKLRRFARPEADTIRQCSYLEFQRTLDAPAVEGEFLGDMDFILEVDEQTAQAVAASIKNAPSLGCGMTLELLHGAACRVGVNETAFSIRRPGFFAYIAATPDEATPRDGANEWVKGVRLALNSVSTGDAYVNGLFVGGEPDQNRVESGYGVNYSRLRELKRRYDPTNFFRLNANIKPGL